MIEGLRIYKKILRNHEKKILHTLLLFNLKLLVSKERHDFFLRIFFLF